LTVLVKGTRENQERNQSQQSVHHFPTSESILKKAGSNNQTGWKSVKIANSNKVTRHDGQRLTGDLLPERPYVNSI
jgi:hypothetical protein